MRGISRCHRVPAITLIALCVLGSPLGAMAADWFQFRGPNRDGISSETGLLAAWPEAGPPELWRVAIGPGFSAITAVGDRIFTMDSDATHEYVAAFEALTGREIWRQRVGELFENDFGNGPRSTPTWDKGVLFVMSSLGNLRAMSADKGETLWQVELQRDFGSQLPTWAFTTAALVWDDTVIVEVGGSDDRTIASFDKRSGELRWTGAAGGLSYSSPIALSFNGVHQTVHLLQQGLVALSPGGETLWSSEFVPQLPIKPAPPVFVEPDLIFVSASYDVGAKMVRLIPDGRSIAVEELWQSRFMRNHFNGSVVVDGHLCGFDKATLKCIEAQTGEQTWARRGLGKGSLILADGKFLVLSERGKLLLLEADPEEMVELASHQVLIGRCWTQPSLANGRLFLRNAREMVAFDVGDKR